MEESVLLEKTLKIENTTHLNEISFLSIPLWRILRYQTRLFYINSKTGYVARTSVVKCVGKKRLKFFSGFWKYLFRKELSIFFSFNRLAFSEGTYLDKFIDPVIEESFFLNRNYVIIDPPSYIGAYERIHKDNTISNESRTLSLILLRFLFKLLTPVLYKRKIQTLFSKIKKEFELPQEELTSFYSSVSIFLANYYYFLFWFNLLRPQRVFVVYREGYFAQIAACKKLGIPVAELQHGITLDNTVSFAGEYDQRIDPDYFLVFGEYWRGPQFGMPLDRIINIGWAYSKYLQETIAKNIEKHDKEVLVISSPEISDAILDTLQELSKNGGEYSFDIRLHPCESYNEAQQQKLKSIPKAKVVDNKTDSALVLPTYKYVVGENSSVIYEALSVGCKVGMLNMCGLRPAINLPGIKENFFVINNREDFERFLTEDSNQSTSKAEFYSDFDSTRFMEFIENKM